MVTIIFESHGTTFDNENHKASGWFDVGLSPLGKKQAKELGERYKNDKFGAIFCSDLKRSYNTAMIAFKDKFPIVQDKRLNECDYGDWTLKSSDTTEKEKGSRIKVPFPNGESYEDTSKRMKEFLQDLLKDYDGKRVMIIGHRATQYGLEHWILDKPLSDAVTAPWSWQPGWEYKLEKIS